MEQITAQSCIKRASDRILWRSVGSETIVVDPDSGASHVLNLSLRTRILQEPALYYEFNHLLTKDDPNPTAYTLSNGLSMNHRFNPTYSMTEYQWYAPATIDGA